ncbi:MAG: cytochrome c-type biogenesis CcmF C-terminal domain-containing protein [Acidimicrobiia bacterium]
MLAWLGTASVLAALAGAVWLAVDGTRSSRADGRLPLRRPVALLVGGAAAAMVVLELALVANDFSIAYVANHHSRTTPFPFNVATAWAALEGSIVLWGLVLAGYTWFVWRGHARSRDGLGAGALAVMGLVSVFFFGLMATVANPFEVCVEAAERRCLTSSPFPWAAVAAPIDGPGPNPLLQNHILMAVHPPLLYLGYVGLTVPFAYAVSALALAVPGAEWLRRSQRWTLIAWSFLTLGIVLGGWWAYEVLSWGGYWAWDPVENASFMPWLIATAFLHSSLVQQRRGMLQAWNFVLVIGAFALTILGTFLTRSGTIASVHSFTQSAIGPALLGFLVLVLVGSFALFAMRAHLVSQTPRLESLSSREGAFLLNNLLLTVYAFVVLVGTLYPLFVEAFTDQQIGVGRPFFDRMAVPLSFGLLLAMGVGPVTPWRLARPGLVWDRIHRPLQIALAAGVVTVLTTSRIGYVVLAVVAGVFVVAVIVDHLWSQARRGATARQTSVAAEARRLVAADLGYWGGQLSHVGVALMAIAIAFAANLSSHADEVVLRPGDQVEFAGFELEYIEAFSRPEPNRLVEGANVEITRNGDLVATLQPRLSRFPSSAQAIVTPAVHTSPRGDLYLTLVGLDGDQIVLDLDTSPLQWLLWAGGLLTATGGFVAARGRRRAPVPGRDAVHV